MGVLALSKYREFERQRQQPPPDLLRRGETVMGAGRYRAEANYINGNIGYDRAVMNAITPPLVDEALRRLMFDRSIVNNDLPMDIVL